MSGNATCVHLEKELHFNNLAVALSKIQKLKRCYMTQEGDVITRSSVMCLSCYRISDLNIAAKTMMSCAAADHKLYLRVCPPHHIYCVNCADFQYSKVSHDSIKLILNRMPLNVPRSDQDQLLDGKESACTVSSFYNTGSRSPTPIHELWSIGSKRSTDDCLSPALFKKIKAGSEDSSDSPLRPSPAQYCMVSNGLCNMGATCFLGSVVQSLLHAPVLQSYYVKSRNAENSWVSGENVGTAQHRDTNVCIPCNLQRLFWANDVNLCSYVQNKKVVRNTRKSIVVPSQLLYSIWKHCNYVAGYHQQDAHELLIALLDGWESQIKDCDASHHSTLSVGTDASSSDSDQNIVAKTFAGTMRSVLTCTNCQHKREKDERFVDLSVGLLQREEKRDRSTGDVLVLQQNMSLLSCLKEFNAVEILLEYSCEHCNTKCSLEKQLFIKTLPKVLTIQLKRFDAVHHKKISGIVTFPLNGLNVSSLLLNESGTSKQCDEDGRSFSSNDSSEPENDLVEPVLYDLSSVICHQGTLDSGHYVTYARRNVFSKTKSSKNAALDWDSGVSGIETGDVSDDGDSCSDLDENIGASTEREGGDDYEWIRCDDEKVTVVPASHVSGVEGYIFFYTKREV